MGPHKSAGGIQRCEAEAGVVADLTTVLRLTLGFVSCTSRQLNATTGSGPVRSLLGR